MRNTLVIFLLCSLIVSCSTMNSADNKEEKQKISTAKINTQLGIAYLGRHDVLRAKQKLLIALQEAPNIPETWYSMGYFLETTGNKAEAQKYYLKAIDLAPSRGDTHNNYGTYLCRIGNYKASIQQFVMATEDPDYLNSGAAFENAGYCALKIPDKTLAKMYFTKAVEHDPSRSASASELGYLS
jgi:type IV pilus assembly protein PilF